MADRTLAEKVVGDCEYMAPSKKSGVFLAVKVEYKKRDTPERMSNEMQMLTRRFEKARRSAELISSLVATSTAQATLNLP